MDKKEFVEISDSWHEDSILPYDEFRQAYQGCGTAGWRRILEPHLSSETLEGDSEMALQNLSPPKM